MRDGSQNTAELYALIRHSIGVAVVAEVVSFSAARSTVSIKPLVLDDRVDAEGTREALGEIVIADVPVIWPGTGTRGISMGLRAGDRGIAVFRHQSHDEVDAGKTAPLLPASTRRMDLSDLVFFPGYVSPATDRPSSQRSTNGEPVVYMDAGDVLRVATAAASIALARADLVEQQLADIQAEFGALATTFSFATVIVDPMTFTGNLPVYVPGYTSGGVGSSRITVDD